MASSGQIIIVVYFILFFTLYGLIYFYPKSIIFKILILILLFASLLIFLIYKAITLKKIDIPKNLSKEGFKIPVWDISTKKMANSMAK